MQGEDFTPPLSPPVLVQLNYPAIRSCLPLSFLGVMKCYIHPQTKEGASGLGAPSFHRTDLPPRRRWGGGQATCLLCLGSDTQPNNPMQVCSLVTNSLYSDYLHRMQSRLGASYSFYGCHGNMVQGADGSQAGIGRKVAGTPD